MSTLTDAVVSSFAGRYDSEKKAVADLITTEASVNRQSVTRAKLDTIKEIRKELKLVRSEDNPDPDIIDALVDLLKDAKAAV